MIRIRLASAATTLMRMVDAETAHGLALRALRMGLAGTATSADPPALSVRAMGLRFPNPIGLAAGFDKNAVAVLPLMRIGFGFVETGTVTRHPQSGNPPPRIFRLPKQRAVINRLGFNSGGIESFRACLAALPALPVPIGVNVGINRSGADPELDYPALVSAVSPFAGYVTINVSSPNTPGLRDLQSEGRLRAILAAISRVVPVRPPLLVKLAPDLSNEGLAAIVEAACDHGVDGLIISNTTIARPADLVGRNAQQAGGLSGAPLFRRSTDMLREAFRLARGRLTLIGCGGVRTGAEAFEKIEAGASLLQIYTEFSYVGPALVPRLKRELLVAMEAAHCTALSDAVGQRA